MIPGLPLERDLPERVGVLVLGSGLAGCAALLAAAEAGQYAVMLEKTSEVGGSTVRSAGLSAFAGTPEQERAGIEDSVDLLRGDLMATGAGHAEQSLVDLYCAHQYETYQWLRGHGVVYGEVQAAAGQSVPRSHPTDTTAMLGHLLRAAGELGARVLLDTPARRLVREGARLVGVEVETATGFRTVWADAVVIATGGFARSDELMRRFAPGMDQALRAGGPGCTGDGLLMAWQLGAGVQDLPHVKGTYGIHHVPHPDEDGTGILAVYKGAIAVNRDGERFVDESVPYKQIGDAALAQPGVTTWQVFDQQVMAASNDEVPIYEFAGRERAGLLLKADTWAELESKIGLPAGSLQRTVSSYNDSITTGQPDAWGRRHLVGGVGTPFPLDRPPFLAHATGTVVLATYCGLTVNENLQVVDVFGEPIERLYAAGEVIGGFHGGGYMTGSSIGKAGIFGRLAGREAATHESELSW